jgi:hypothetical protein
MLERTGDVTPAADRTWGRADELGRRPLRRQIGVLARRGGPPWRWAALPFGVAYLILLAVQFRGVVATTILDADAVSAPVIGQLFGSAPAHASVVLGEFGWYQTLLFELATKWLPAHRQIWEVAPYAMTLAGAGLAAWSVWQVAGRWAASLTAVLLVCAAPVTLRLLLSMTQHAPDWFCLGLLAAFLVLLESRASALRWRIVVPMTLVVGATMGVNAASDPLVVIAGLVPFSMALLAGYSLVRGRDGLRALLLGGAALVVTGICLAITLVVVAALNVSREPGLHTTALATGDKIASNFKLWWQSIAVLGNGDFFGRGLSFTSGLAVACGLLSIGAVVLLPRMGWRELSIRANRTATPAAAARLTFMVFWCSSAVLLSAAFILSATPVDIHADRYLVGLIYAAAAVIPAIATGRLVTEAAVLAGTCIFALSGVISMAQGTATRNTEGVPATRVVDQIARIAGEHHLQIGYAGYWNAAPITWATHFGVQVYPVSICDQGAHLCRFDLHFISSWYTPRPGIGSFLLTDPSLANVPAPTPDLGRPTAVYHVGRITMRTYPYDLATKIVH